MNRCAVQAQQQAVEASPEKALAPGDAWQKGVRSAKIASAVLGAGALFAVTGEPCWRTRRVYSQLRSRLRQLGLAAWTGGRYSSGKCPRPCETLPLLILCTAAAPCCRSPEHSRCLQAAWQPRLWQQALAQPSPWLAAPLAWALQQQLLLAQSQVRPDLPLLMLLVVAQCMHSLLRRSHVATDRRLQSASGKADAELEPQAQDIELSCLSEPSICRAGFLGTTVGSAVLASSLGAAGGSYTGSRLAHLIGGTLSELSGQAHWTARLACLPVHAAGHAAS